MIRKLFYKDLQSLGKNPWGFILLISMPLVLALLMNLVFNSGDSQDSVMPRSTLVIADHDSSLASRFLKSAFAQGELKNLFEIEQITEEKGRERVRQDKASALLIIPKGFADSLLNQNPVDLQLIKNPAQAFGPKIAEEALSILTQGADRLVHIASEPLAMIREQMDTDEPSDAQISAIAVAINQLMKRGGARIFNSPISIDKQEARPQEERFKGASLFAYFLSGISTMMLLFILNSVASQQLKERENKTLHRILVAPASPSHYLISKQLYLFFSALIAFGLVWGVAFLFFGFRCPAHSIVPFIVLTLVIAAASAGLIGLLHAFVTRRNIANSVLPAVIIFFSVVGGGMIPLGSLPGFVKSIAVISPVYWGTDGIQVLFFRETGFAAIHTHLIVLAAIAVLSMLIALPVQRKKVMS
ncbi:MAG: ABC transporter permease [candidate division KSB1 bacterium]|nr:ABC transporter permease [candidate division KSB1 bacterium]